MAEDCVIGFEFLNDETADRFEKDAAVLSVSEDLFAEMISDTSFDHLGIKGEDDIATSTRDAGDLALSDEFGGFEISDGFDFVL